MATENEKQGRLNLVISALSNALLITVKLFLGMLGRSQALIADAIHSTTDFATDILAFFGLHYAEKGEDRDHPFGHGKIDTLMSMLIGIAMLLAGMWLAVEAVTAIVTGELTTPTWWALLGAMISLLIKEGLFHYTLAVGRRTGSQSLVANAWHHRSDAFSSLAVLLGVAPGIINSEWAIFDPLAALIVASMIFKFGLDVVIPAFRDASDTSPGQDILDRIERTVYAVEGVRNAHDIRARYYSSKLYVEVHIIVDPDISVREGHNIAVAVRQALCGKFEEVMDAIIHIDPDDDDHAHHFERDLAL